MPDGGTTLDRKCEKLWTLSRTLPDDLLKLAWVLYKVEGRLLPEAYPGRSQMGNTGSTFYGAGARHAAIP
jgi:hypothetical protein